MTARSRRRLMGLITAGLLLCGGPAGVSAGTPSAGPPGYPDLECDTGMVAHDTFYIVPPDEGGPDTPRAALESYRSGLLPSEEFARLCEADFLHRGR